MINGGGNFNISGRLNSSHKNINKEPIQKPKKSDVKPSASSSNGYNSLKIQ